MTSFQGICLRHSKYHSLNHCSARRFYIQWLVLCYNHTIWRQWRRLNNVQWLSIVYVQAWLRSTCWNSWMRENHLNWVLYTSGMLAFRMDEETLQTMTATDDQKLKKGKGPGSKKRSMKTEERLLMKLLIILT